MSIKKYALVFCGLFGVFATHSASLAVNTIDSSLIPPKWAIDRVANVNTDSQGVTLQIKTGERIRSILITPAGWVQVQPLDGVLCKESSCSGSAPTAILINKGPRPALGMSFVTITTNSRNIYKLRVRYGAPSKRTVSIGG
jgi:hypothetical protein